MTPKDKLLDSSQFKLACGNCSLGQLCLTDGLTEEEIKRLDSLVSKRDVLHRGDYLYREGHKFNSVAVIRSGSFKAIKRVVEGDDRIEAFYFAGEMCGLHAIHPMKYLFDIVALETSSVCELPFDGLFEFATQLPTLQKHLLGILSQKLSSDFYINPNSHAEERVAKFLMSVSKRLERRGFSPHQFNLSMSRADMANYLGLAAETVSRVFSRLQADEIIKVDRKTIELLNVRQLQILAYGAD